VRPVAVRLVRMRPLEVHHQSAPRRYAARRRSLQSDIGVNAEPAAACTRVLARTSTYTGTLRPYTYISIYRHATRHIYILHPGVFRAF